MYYTCTYAPFSPTQRTGCQPRVAVADLGFEKGGFKVGEAGRRVSGPS